MLEDFLESLGHSVSATCESVSDALVEAEKGGFDVAILDVNLKGESVWPVATGCASRTFRSCLRRAATSIRRLPSSPTSR